MSEEPDIFQARLWAWPTAACAPHTVCVTGSLGDADTERCRRLAHAWRRMRTGLKKELRQSRPVLFTVISTTKF